MSRTQEQIAVMQASLEGKRIEARALPQGDWKPFDPELGWNWQHYAYRVAEPAEPRRFKAVIRVGGDPTRLYPYDKGDDDDDNFTIVEVIEALPGWKLVPPVAGRPLPDGVPQPPDGFDYWGVGPLPHLDYSSECIVIGFYGGLWKDGEGDGLQGSFEGRHYAIRRNTALHAANFGEVGR